MEDKKNRKKIPLIELSKEEKEAIQKIYGIEIEEESSEEENSEEEEKNKDDDER